VIDPTQGFKVSKEAGFEKRKLRFLEAKAKLPAKVVTRLAGFRENANWLGYVATAIPAIPTMKGIAMRLVFTLVVVGIIFTKRVAINLLDAKGVSEDAFVIERGLWALGFLVLIILSILLPSPQHLVAALVWRAFLSLGLVVTFTMAFAPNESYDE
jgi:cell division protein FtsW (lipid II flippase)